MQTLQNIEFLSKTAARLKDSNVVTLASVIKLKTLVDAHMLDGIPSVLIEIGNHLGIECLKVPVQTDSESQNKEPDGPVQKLKYNTAFENAMAVHVLLLGVIYYTQLGKSKPSSALLLVLHQLLDEGILETFDRGYLMVRWPAMFPCIYLISYRSKCTTGCP